MEFFLFMTGSASLLILSALLLRPLTGRVLPRALQMALWIAASVRLLLPVNIRTPFSILSMLALLRPAAKPVVTPVPQTVPLPSAAPAPALPMLPDAAPVSPAEPAASLSFLELLPWIWLFGTVLMAGILLLLHLREMRRCREKTRDPQAEQHTPRFVRVYRCHAAASPFTAGLFRPQIILPETMPSADLPAVLAHECAHIRGLDILKKHLFAAALCVNWFNPLVWIMVELAARDLEILCDARALRRPDAPDAKTYAHALLNAEERRTLFTLGFSNHTEVRIMKILKKENINRFTLCISILLVSLLITACTTSHAAGIKSGNAPEPEVSVEKSEAESESGEITDAYVDTPDSEIEPESSQMTDEYLDTPESEVEPESSQITEEYEQGYWETTKPGPESSQITEEYEQGYWETVKPGPESSQITEEYEQGYWETTKLGPESSPVTEEFVDENTTVTNYFPESYGVVAEDVSVQTYWEVINEYVAEYPDEAEINTEIHVLVPESETE